MISPAEMKLPEYVRPCGCCGGEGEYEQMYTVGCGGGYYRSKGRCDWCTPKDGKHRWKGVGFLYKHNGEPVPDSVLAQIEVMNRDAA